MPNTGILILFAVLVVVFVVVIYGMWGDSYTKKQPDDEEESGEKEEESLTRQRIENCVRNLLEEERGKPKAEYDILDLDFYNKIGLDSLDTIELIIAMNTSLGTDIDTEIIEKEGITTGRELVEIVVKLS